MAAYRLHGCPQLHLLAPRSTYRMRDPKSHPWSSGARRHPPIKYEVPLPERSRPRRQPCCHSPRLVLKSKSKSLRPVGARVFLRHPDLLHVEKPSVSNCSDGRGLGRSPCFFPSGRLRPPPRLPVRVRVPPSSGRERTLTPERSSSRRRRQGELVWLLRQAHPSRTLGSSIDSRDGSGPR